MPGVPADHPLMLEWRIRNGTVDLPWGGVTVNTGKHCEEHGYSPLLNCYRVWIRRRDQRGQPGRWERRHDIVCPQCRFEPGYGEKMMREPIGSFDVKTSQFAMRKGWQDMPIPWEIELEMRRAESHADENIR